MDLGAEILVPAADLLPKMIRKRSGEVLISSKASKTPLEAVRIRDEGSLGEITNERRAKNSKVRLEQ